MIGKPIKNFRNESRTPAQKLRNARLAIDYWSYDGNGKANAGRVTIPKEEEMMF